MNIWGKKDHGANLRKEMIQSIELLKLVTQNLLERERLLWPNFPKCVFSFLLNFCLRNLSVDPKDRITVFGFLKS